MQHLTAYYTLVHVFGDVSNEQGPPTSRGMAPTPHHVVMAVQLSSSGFVVDVPLGDVQLQAGQHARETDTLTNIDSHTFRSAHKFCRTIVKIRLMLIILQHIVLNINPHNVYCTTYSIYYQTSHEVAYCLEHVNYYDELPAIISMPAYQDSPTHPLARIVNAQRPSISEYSAPAIVSSAVRSRVLFTATAAAE